MEQDSSRRRVLLVVAVLVVALIAAVVVLALAGRSAADIGALLGVVVAVLGGVLPILDGVLKLRAETHQQTEVLTQIHENTNGKLDKRIRDAVSQAMSRVDSVQYPRRLRAAIEAEEHRRSTQDGPHRTDGENPYPTSDSGAEGLEHPFD